MKRPVPGRHIRALVHTLRYQGLRGVAWKMVETILGPFGQVGLECLCRKDLTRPLKHVEARVAIEIGPATEADVDQIVALAEGLWGAADEIGPYNELGVRGTVLERFERGQKCFVAKIGEEIAHYNWIGFDYEETIAGTGRFLVLSDGEAVCHDGMTVEAMRGKGIHTAVHNQMLVFLKESGFTCAYTVVGAMDRSANITHHRLDWEISGTMLYFISHRTGRAFVRRARGTLQPFDSRSKPARR